MNTDSIINLFETSHVMNYVGLFFIFNISIIILEIIADFMTKKQRRWKDTTANIAIYFLGKITDKLLLGTLGIIALIPIYYLVSCHASNNGYNLLSFIRASFVLNCQLILASILFLA